MSENGDHASIMDKITDKIHEYKGDSSSSDSENEIPSIILNKKKRLFGRTEPIHFVLGGAKAADLVLWRNKQVSGGILAGITVIWLLFEWIGYHLLTFSCHALMLVLAISFVWSSAASLVNRSPPKFLEIILAEDLCIQIAQTVRHEINEALITLHYIASGNDLKTFLKVIAGLWLVSIVGSWFSLLTLSYIVFLIAYTGPVFYEKYEDHVDSYGDKAIIQIKKYYEVLDEKVLQKVPRGPFGDKKQH
ncbi:hypothetical protein LUZ60_013161 [Juncus effusus]|nr:hypothetical protein LUZ60_013161 [Juncus effusus]